jgi:hypothetical protein
MLLTELIDRLLRAIRTEIIVRIWCKGGDWSMHFDGQTPSDVSISPWTHSSFDTPQTFLSLSSMASATMTCAETEIGFVCNQGCNDKYARLSSKIIIQNQYGDIRQESLVVFPLVRRTYLNWAPCELPGIAVAKLDDGCAWLSD